MDAAKRMAILYWFVFKNPENHEYIIVELVYSAYGNKTLAQWTGVEVYCYIIGVFDMLTYI